jgi:hypothetical protein
MIRESFWNNFRFTSSSTINTGVWMLPIMLCWISSTLMAPMVPGIGSHALLTKMSTRPIEATASAIVRWHVGSKMSATLPAITKDCGRCRFVLLKMEETSSLSEPVILAMLASLVQVPRMEHPRNARFMAIALPIPRDAPVMSATLPKRSSSRVRGVSAILLVNSASGVAVVCSPSQISNQITQNYLT